MDEQANEPGFSAENAIFNGRFIPLKRIPIEGPHPGFCLGSFPDIDVASTSEILIQPPLPIIQTAIPARVDYLKKILSKDFWNIQTRIIKDVRPDPVVAASYKFPNESDRDWKVPGQTVIVAALTPITSAEIDRLLGLSPI
ncbi:uncharacterized protein PAC_13288 [Phialocephala subalpina]|uniref:Uncharacterized protein n=1 Tax=Phialocephala subalpina TaxID=576137 RepID=A0A1L7XED8_9HELO|nr:uncharacterized protein PAC_13288 [Phialocephala subalpina]